MEGEQIRSPCDEPRAIGYSYAVVCPYSTTVLACEDAAAHGIPGIVVGERGGQNDANARVTAGDLLIKVNGLDVIGRNYDEVLELLEMSFRPLTLEFVPYTMIPAVEQVLAYRVARDAEKSIVVGDHLHSVMQKGQLYEYDDESNTWKPRVVVLRMTTIEFFEVARGYLTKVDELSLVNHDDASGSLGVVAGTTRGILVPENAEHVMELHLRDRSVVFACASEAKKTEWIDALKLALDVCSVLVRQKIETAASPLVVPASLEQALLDTLDPLKRELLYDLLEKERQSLRDLPRRAVEILVQQTCERLKTVDLSDTTARNDEYDRLNQELIEYAAVLAVYVGDEARRDREWREHAEENVKALETVRRCMPVDVGILSTFSKQMIADEITPNGKRIPNELVNQFYLSVIELLRVDPHLIVSFHPSDLRMMSSDGLTLIERRALHAHLRGVADEWRAKDVNPLTNWLLEWFDKLKRTLQCLADVHKRHVQQYGPATIHRRDPSLGCPLGHKCPVEQDQRVEYEDLGYPEGEEYVDSAEYVKYKRQRYQQMANAPPSRDYGFLSAVMQCYGASSIWNDPELLQLQLNADEITTSYCLKTQTNDENNRKPLCEVWAGFYRNQRVAIKQLTNGGKTLANATALASVCKSIHSLSHPNLVPLVGLQWKKALGLQVLTPLAARGDLRSRLDSDEAAASLTWADFKCQVAIDIASALAYLHQHKRSVGFGTLTSRNVLLEEDGTAKLSLVQTPCRGVDDAMQRVPSSLLYNAPEVLKQQTDTVDCRADIFVFGVLLTELDTTKLPYSDVLKPDGTKANEYVTLTYIIRQGIRPTLSADCPPAIAQLVGQCLEENPEQRPQAEQIVYKLQEILKNEL